jgi:hypothetical protein
VVHRDREELETSSDMNEVNKKERKTEVFFYQIDRNEEIFY